MSDDMIGDEFETAAVTWSQPEAAVMMSMFEFYGIPAYLVGEQSIRTMSYIAVAAQGIQVRVHRDWLDEALLLLADVAERPAVVRPYVFRQPRLYQALVFLAGAMYVLAWEFFLANDPLDMSDTAMMGMILLFFPMGLLLAAPPPTRTASTFMLWKRSAAPA